MVIQYLQAKLAWACNNCTHKQIHAPVRSLINLNKIETSDYA